MGVPVGVAREPRARARARAASTSSTAFEPGLPSLSYLALRDAEALTVATFFSPERLGYPPGQAQRERLLGRVDALLATSERRSRRRRSASRATTGSIPHGRRHSSSSARRRSERRIVVEWRPDERPRRAGGASRAARASGLGARAAADEAALRPALRSRARSRTASRCATARDGAGRAAPLLARRAVFVPALEGLCARCASRRPAAGCRDRRAAGACRAARARRRAALARLAEDPSPRPPSSRPGARRRPRRRASPPSRPSSRRSTSSLARRRRPPARATATRSRTAPWILADLHMHTDAGRTTAGPGAELVDHAEAAGPRRDRGHRPQRLRRRARGGRARRAAATLVVIPGEEVKTDDQGEVIGLFLERGDPARHVVRRHDRGDQGAGRRSSTSPTRSTACTRSPTRRRCTATSPRSTCSRSTTRGSSSRRTTTRRSASPASTTSRWAPARTPTSSRASARASSACARSTAPEEFLSSLRTAEILRRPKSLVYLQWPQVGGPGQGKGSLRKRARGPVV